MNLKSPNLDPQRHRGKRRNRGFSLIEVILAIGLLAFGIGIAMRMLTGALESLRTAKSANAAMEVVPIVEAKLEQPGIDGPQALNVQSKTPLKRRFFDELFREIKGSGAVQLLVYNHDQESSPGSNRINALGAKFLEFPGVGGGTLDKYLSSDTSQLTKDSPEELYRIILSASPVNDQKLIVETTVKTPSVQDFSRGFEPEFYAYDIVDHNVSGPSSSSSPGGQTIDIAKIKSAAKPEEVTSLAVRIHLFPQSLSFAQGNFPTREKLNQSIRAKDLAFTFDTLLLAY